MQDIYKPNNEAFTLKKITSGLLSKNAEFMMKKFRSGILDDSPRSVENIEFPQINAQLDIDPLFLSTGVVLYYFKKFKENELNKQQGLLPDHKIYKELKFIRPIKRKILIKEVMKMLQTYNSKNGLGSVEKLDFGISSNKVERFLKSLTRESIITRLDSRFGRRQNIYKRKPAKSFIGSPVNDGTPMPSYAIPSGSNFATAIQNLIKEEPSVSSRDQSSDSGSKLSDEISSDFGYNEDSVKNENALSRNIDVSKSRKIKTKDEFKIQVNNIPYHRLPSITKNCITKADIFKSEKNIESTQKFGAYLKAMNPGLVKVKSTRVIRPTNNPFSQQHISEEINPHLAKSFIIKTDSPNNLNSNIFKRADSDKFIGVNVYSKKKLPVHHQGTKSFAGFNRDLASMISKKSSPENDENNKKRIRLQTVNFIDAKEQLVNFDSTKEISNDNNFLNTSYSPQVTSSIKKHMLPKYFCATPQPLSKFNGISQKEGFLTINKETKALDKYLKSNFKKQSHTKSLASFTKPNENASMNLPDCRDINDSQVFFDLEGFERKKKNHISNISSHNQYIIKNQGRLRFTNPQLKSLVNKEKSKNSDEKKPFVIKQQHEYNGN